MNIQGTITEIKSVQVISDKFQKREFAVKTEGDYPQEIGLQLANDKCSLIDSFKVGDNVKCERNIRGRKWLDPKTNENKYFNTLDVWKIEDGGLGF